MGVTVMVLTPWTGAALSPGCIPGRRVQSMLPRCVGSLLCCTGVGPGPHIGSPGEGPEAAVLPQGSLRLCLCFLPPVREQGCCRSFWLKPCRSLRVTRTQGRFLPLAFCPCLQSRPRNL